MATQPAVVGMARLNNFRLGYESAALAAIRRTRVTVLIAGVLANNRVRMYGLTIHDIVNEAPNTCSLIVDTTAPTEGQALRITINSDTPVLLFAGALQTVDRSYEGKPIAAQRVWPCTAIDDTGRVNRKRPFGTWVDTSATTIAQWLLNFAPGFTGVNIAAGLPLVSVTFDGSSTWIGCLSQLATLIGGYCYVEDLDVHLFQTETSNPPDNIDSGHPFLNDPPITATSDDSQLMTRVYGKGHAETLSNDVAAGETVLPIANAVMYNVTGGQVIASTTPDGAQSEILSYTGLRLGGSGALVGPGVTPGTAPVPTPASGGSIGAGDVTYAYTWKTGAGETLPSPLATVTLGVATDPAAGPSVSADTTTWSTQAGLGVGDSVQVGVQFANDFAFTAGVTNVVDGGSLTVPEWDGGGGHPSLIRYSLSGSRPTFARYAMIYFKKNAGSYQGNGSPANLGTGSTFAFSGTLFDSFGSAPFGTSATIEQVALSGIAIGPTGTTQRKIYRTVVGGSQLKLQQTIADNTSTTGVTDNTADGSLGANAPTSDTSGLTTADGQVNAGSTSILTTSAGPFSASGGWADLSGKQLIRYTGISGNTLTGIPANGIGAIVNSVKYGQPILDAPALTGVTGLTKTLQKGATVAIWVQRNDLTAQSEAAARETTATYLSDGIHEHVLVDGRRGETSLIALCDAHLTLFSRPLVTVHYATRDVKTKSGKPVFVNLTTPAISETLTIQDVTISEIDIAPRLAPRFTVTASSVRFSLESILQKLLREAP